jgi:hypothetical protein
VLGTLASTWSWTDDPEGAMPTYRTVDEMLEVARATITRVVVAAQGTAEAATRAT